MKIHFTLKLLKIAGLGLLIGVLSGCSSTRENLRASELGSNPGLLSVRLAWATNVGPVDFSLEPKIHEKGLLLVSSSGSVIAVNIDSGVQSIQIPSDKKIAAGLGNSAETTAMVSRDNELITTFTGREVWRQKLTTQVFTAPLVAGGRVFVLAADRSVSAFDALSGRRLWTVQRPSESLVLRQSGVLLAAGDTLVVGLSGQLVGINPNNGAVRWESPIASPRGTNEIERLVDLIGPVSRDANIICSRAFQAAVGCVDATSGSLIWSKPANGSVGLAGNASYVYGTESDGKLVAWRRSNGEIVWASERLKLRRLSAPVLFDKSVVFGDDEGNVHFVSAEDGRALAYLKTDGSAVVAGPILVGRMLVVVTRNGGVFGIKPE